MEKIQVDYDAVETKLSQMRSHITTNINAGVMQEYRQMQSNLMQADGEAQKELREAAELNRKKALACTSIMERLFSFMTNSSRQIQKTEEKIARAFNTPRRT